MRRLIPLLLLAGLPAHAQTPPPVWTVTCSEGGRTVYLERIAGQPGPAKEQQVTARFPGATCAYLAPESSSNELPGIGAVIGNLSAPTGTPGDINAALRVLRGEKLGLGVTPAPSPPPSPVLSLAPTAGLGVLIDEPVQRVEPSPPPLPPETTPGRLRIATYGTVNNEDVVADWQRRVAMQPALRGYVPVLTHVGRRTVLSIDGIRDDEREGLCLLVSLVGHSCSGQERQDLGPAVASLSLSYPSHFFLSPPDEMSPRIPEIEQAACDWRMERSPRLRCDRGPLALAGGMDFLAKVGAPTGTLKATPVTRPPAVASQRKPGPAKSSSRSAPRSSSAIASETATKARTDSALIR